MAGSGFTQDNIDSLFKERQVLLISGEQGMGKSTIARKVYQNLKNEGMPTSMVKCEKENITPYSDLIALLDNIAPDKDFGDLFNPAVITGYFIIDSSGTLVSSAIKENKSLDSDIFAGMITAVKEFIKDTMNMIGFMKESKASPEIISSFGYTIMVSGLGNGYVAFIINGHPSVSLLTFVKNFSSMISSRYGALIKNWDGGGERVTDIQKFLIENLRENKRFYPRRGEILSVIAKNLSLMGDIFLIVDDAHWIDPSSLDVLSSLSEWGLENVHTLYLFNFQKAKKHRGFYAFINRYNRDIIPLQPWNTSTVRNMLVEKFGEQPWIDELSSVIVEKTGGKVILVVNFIEKLREYGILKKFGNSYILNRKTLEKISPITSLPQIWDEKIAKLPMDTRRMLKILSVVGDLISMNFATRLLRKDEMEVMFILDPAMELEIINVDDKGIVFKNQGLRKSLYKSINDNQKRVYHRAVANLMAEMKYPPSKVAYHYYMAGDKNAIEYLREAVADAEKINSYLEMYRYCKMALELCPEDRFYFLIKKSEACNVLGYMDESLKLLQEADSYATSHNQYLMIFRDIADAYFRQGYYSKVVDEARRFEGKVGEENRAYITLELSRAMWRLGRFEDGERYLKEIINTKMDDELAMEVYRLYGVIKTSLRDENTAEGYYIKSLDYAKKIGNLYGMSAASNNLAIIYVDKGDMERAEEFYRKALEYDKKMGDLRGASLVMINLAELMITKGNLDMAEEMFREIIDIKSSIGDMEGLGFAQYGLGETLFLKGEYEEAFNHAERARKIFEDIEFREGIGFSGFLIARLLFIIDKKDEALRLLAELVNLFRDLKDDVSAEQTELLMLTYKLKSGEKINIPQLENEENNEQYYYLLSIKNMIDGRVDDGIENLEMCRVEAKKSKSALGYLFYELLIKILKGICDNCLSELKERGAGYYLDEIQYIRGLVYGKP